MKPSDEFDSLCGSTTPQGLDGRPRAANPMGAEGPPEPFPNPMLGVSLSRNAASERRLFETRLRESEETFRSYVEQSIDVIFTLDAQGTFTFLSPAWERHFGFPASEVVGKPFAPFVHPDDIQPCMEYLLRVFSTGQAVHRSGPRHHRKPDGRGGPEGKRRADAGHLRDLGSGHHPGVPPG